MTITVTISNVSEKRGDILNHINQLANIEGLGEIGGGMTQDGLRIEFVENNEIEKGHSMSGL
ncbi:MAG: hypothetical protein ACLRSH_06765 [Turicibacter sp.]